MDIELRYGKENFNISIPKNCVTVIAQQETKTLENEIQGIRNALRDPISSKPLREITRSTDSIAIVFSDITRPVPYQKLLPVILEELGEIDKDQVVLINALGTHRKNTDEELQDLLGADIFKDYRVHQHDCDDETNLSDLGRSKNDTQILINKIYCHSDIRILTGFIEPHLFAGFSGGPKAILPGIAGRETIHVNHGPGMIASKSSGFGITHGNPIWEEMMEVALYTKPHFLINTTQTPGGRITGVFAGDLEKAHYAGVNFAKQSAMVPVQEKFDIVISTAGGYPLDISLYQAVKGLAVAGNIVRDGGAIILVAECEEGLPDYGEYADVLETSRSPQELLSKITDGEISMQDQWDAQIQAMICSRVRFFIYSDGLSDDDIKKAFGVPCREIYGLLDDLLREKGDKTRIAVMPDGPQSVPYLDRA
jgi:nickel-dependent lactate racemase